MDDTITHVHTPGQPFGVRLGCVFGIQLVQQDLQREVHQAGFDNVGVELGNIQQ